ncbi:MAG TPA: response regulator transcription factor [Spirochaetia bacterium]|nr:response regulator transcription factor [Spirochaetia bacterium]
MAREPLRVLVVDDEPKIAEVVGSYLVKAGFEPVSAATGTQALELFEKVRPCLVILDLMLPDLSGEDICRTLRARSRVPIIMLTAKAADADAVKGLGLGADDYVTKPFSPRQLMARVQAVLRRTEGASSPLAQVLRFGEDDLVIDTGTDDVRKGGLPVSMTAREYRLLRVLAANPGRVFSREELITHALGEDYSGFDRTIDVHVKNIRKKIETDHRQPRYILTVHGIGYRFAAEARP